MKFSDFDLNKSILDGLRDLKYEDPTPIQRDAIPVALKGDDIIGLAQTGTGKTGAFVVPILQAIMKSNHDDHTPQALILTPTRELAKQVDQMIYAMGFHTGVSSATVIGGEDFSAQVKHIRSGVDIIVATPGRLLDIMRVLEFDLSSINTLVLDEADRMLDMGFYPDVSKIVKQVPEDRQTMLFSATMSSEIEELTREIMKQPKKFEFEVSKPVDTVEQHAYFVDNSQKLKLIEKIFDTEDWETAIVFVGTKKWTAKLHDKLQERGVNSVSIHGDRTQEERNEALQAFRNGENPVIVATDVLSRGIDIDDVSMIVNYDLPQNSDDYIHRIGRTGRHKQSGVAITFVTNREKSKYKAIKNEVGLDIKEYKASTLLNGTSPGKKKDKSKDKSDADKKKDKRQQNRKSGSTRNQHNKDSKKQSDSQQKRSQEQTKKSGKQQKQRERGKTAPRNIKSRDKQKKNGADKGVKDHSGKRQRKKDRKRSENRKKQRSNSNDKNKKREKHQRSKKQHTTNGTGNNQNKFVIKRIEKAIQRNKKTRKPAKGIWGIIKSLIPKFKED